MAISPINSVSFNNYNNVTFAGRKNKKHHSGASNPIKVIPLALLLAMSPVTDSFSKEPYTSDIIELNETQQNRKTPLPSNFSYLHKFIINMPKGGKIGLNFIDNDKNKNNFEMLEYTCFDDDDAPITRGIVKGIRFYSGENGKVVHIHGIGLSTTDLEDYTPHGGLSDIITPDEFYDFFYGLIYEDANNNSIRLVRPGSHYEVGDDMREYKRAIGIIK